MFVNRKTEIERLKLVLKSSKACLVVIYGRRRCGKSTLIRRLMSRDSVYFSADMRERPLQIKAFAERMEVMIPGFAAPVYPDWNSVFRALNAALARKITVCIDEFPYLVRNSSDLPSVLQNLHDDNAHGRYHLILCGSSQKMMNDMVLNRKAPLYGRADEIMRIQPMSVSHLKSFLRITAIDAVEEYSVWGGIPRYWEIRKPFGSLAETISWHVANPYGLLYDEPERLFSDEIRTSVQAYTMLSLIGSGCNRLSEIAARMEKPATHLSGTLAFLTELKYIRREIPFGESVRSTRRTLYKIEDPFLNFWFTFIVPARSRIELGLTQQVVKSIINMLPSFTAATWEELCRRAVPFLMAGQNFGPASRWWGTGIDGTQAEVDIVAESSDGRVLLIGEAKWAESTDVKGEMNKLTKKVSQLPFAGEHTVITALFLKKKPVNKNLNMLIFGPDEVVKALS